MGQITPSDVERHPHLRPAAADIARFRELPDLPRHLGDLAKWKEDAVKTQGDELQAKAIWCLERLIAAHSEFTLTHGLMRSGDVVVGFDKIEHIITATHHLSRHLNDAGGKFGLDLIHKTARNWVTLLDPPYGFSQASIVKRAYCSICKTKVGVIWPCGHVKGEIYGGEQCLRIVKEARVVGVSPVDRPVSLLLRNHTRRMLYGSDMFQRISGKTTLTVYAVVPRAGYRPQATPRIPRFWTQRKMPLRFGKETQAVLCTR